MLDGVYEVLLARLVKRGAAAGTNVEDIDDFALSRDAGVFSERENVTGMNIEAKCRQETAQNRKLRQIIECNDDDVEFTGSLRPRSNLDLSRLFGDEPGRHPNVLTNGVGRKSCEIVIVHPAEELFDGAFCNAGAARRYSFFPLFGNHTLSYQEAWER